MLTIYGDMISGNCLKVKYVADYLDIDYSWHHIDVVAGDAQKADFKAINPAAQVPTVQLEDGKSLSQSNAIMRYLAQGSALIPTDSWLAAKIDEWMFWEQYTHETSIAVTRFQVLFQGTAINDRDPKLVAKGEAALKLMETHLKDTRWFVGEKFSLADIALYAYTQFAPDAGFNLDNKPNIKHWLTKVQSALNI